MKNFRKSISINKRASKLFVQLSVVALFAVVTLLLWRTSAQMKAIHSESSPNIGQFSYIGANLQSAMLGVANANNSLLIPTLGNYPNTMVVVGGNTTVTPDAVPTSATSINASTNTNFKGTFAVNPTTGVVRVTNAHPAGTYTVTVKAFDAGGMTSRTFTLTVNSGVLCNGTVQFTNAADVSVGSVPVSATIGDFNNDGNQDIATANSSGDTVSVRLEAV